jgi:hypothetical protein
MLAADVGHSGPALRLPQCAQNLLLGMSLFRHLRILLDRVQRTTLADPDSTYPWLAFGFWVTFRVDWQFDWSRDVLIMNTESIVLLTEMGESLAQGLVGEPYQSLERQVQL